MRPALALLALALTLVACETDTTGTGTVVQLSRIESAGDEAPRFSAWSAPVNVGTPVNSAFADINPSISKDGLTLFFDCGNCPENIGLMDVWVAQRTSLDAPWGPRQNLGPIINTTAGDGAPSISRDGHRLYFLSQRPGGFGVQDLYVSRRQDKRDPLGWEEPVNLGANVNTEFAETAPEISEDDAGTVLYFASTRPGGPGGTDIYTSRLGPDGTLGPATLVAELSGPANDGAPTVRRDGLEIIFSSDRPGSIPPAPNMPSQVIDLWVSTRASTSDPWSPPVNLGLVVNSQFIEQSPALSWDGTELYFHSPFRPGNVGGTQFDVWMTTRSKLTGQDSGTP